MKRAVLGQYFTKRKVVMRLVDVLSEYRSFDRGSKVLEPSFGTGNFLSVLSERGFESIDGCEIDSDLRYFKRNKAMLDRFWSDFLTLPMDRKYDLIIGNPPFSKFNVQDSYFDRQKYECSTPHPLQYLSKRAFRVSDGVYLTASGDRCSQKEKMRIENVFVLKAIKHLRDNSSVIAFVLPVSFFIANKNTETKKRIRSCFSTAILFQDDMAWFDYDIPCVFAVFINTGKQHLNDKIVMIYEGRAGRREEIVDKSRQFTEDVIPRSYIYKKDLNGRHGLPLGNFLSDKSVKYKKSYDDYNVSGACITQMNAIPIGVDVRDYMLAVSRVGNSSVGRAGLVNIKKDVLNGMFFVFAFRKRFNRNKKFKEMICRKINENQEHFVEMTDRVGSKSIKKRDVLRFKIDIKINDYWK